MDNKTIALVFTLVLSAFLGVGQQKIEAASKSVVNAVDQNTEVNTSKYLLAQNDDDSSDDSDDDSNNGDQY